MCLFFCKFQPGIAFKKSVAYKKSVYLKSKNYFKAGLSNYILSGNRSKSDHSYRIAKFVLGSYYWWQHFLLGNRSWNDCAYRIYQVACTTWKREFSISCTHDKTKHKMKEDQYEKNTKDNSIWINGNLSY